MLGSAWLRLEKNMSKIWGIPSPYKSGAQKPPFWTMSQLNDKFNGLSLWNETRYRQSFKCVDNNKGSPTSSQNVMNFGPQRLKIGPPFYPPYVLPICATYSPSSLDGIERTSSTWSEISAIWKRMSKIWGIPCPYKSGVQKPPFSTT